MRAIVTQRESLGPHGGPIDSLEREYVEFLAAMGFEAFPISSFTEDVIGFFGALAPDLVVLSGGGIVQADAYRYGVQGWRQVERDAVEDELIRLALEAGLPVLGICRGMHKLNAYYGGKVSDFDGLRKDREIGEMHPVEAADGTRFDVNHFHRDGMFPCDLGDGVELLAVDPDNGTVEALRHAEHKILGVQWHPERMAAGEPGRVWMSERTSEILAERRRIVSVHKDAN